MHANYCKDNYYCMIKAKNRNETYLNFLCELNQTVDSLILHFTLNYQMNNLQYRKFLIDTEEYPCDLIADGKKKVNNLLITNLKIDQLIRNHSNIIRNCPWSGELRVDNFPIKKIQINTTLVPTGRFMMEFNLKQNKASVIKIALYVSISS